MKDEASAKRTLRKAIERQCPGSFTWTNTDAFRHGLPDFFLAYKRLVIAVEAKFIQELPKKRTSQALKHPVSASQVAFLTKYSQSGNVGVILIGLEDVFAYTFEYRENYTLEEVLSMPRIEKGLSGEWNVSGFLEAATDRFFGKHTGDTDGKRQVFL